MVSHLHTLIHTHLLTPSTRTHLHIHTDLHTYTYSDSYSHLLSHTTHTHYTLTHVHTLIHSHTHIHTPTHTHTHLPLSILQEWRKNWKCFFGFKKAMLGGRAEPKSMVEQRVREWTMGGCLLPEIPLLPPYPTFCFPFSAQLTSSAPGTGPAGPTTLCSCWFSTANQRASEAADPAGGWLLRKRPCPRH